jgi:hypothetical protein
MEDEDANFFDDPPPVSFDCDSFVLTGQGTEFVVLNPFTLTLSVYGSVLDHVVHSDEGMMERAWRAASSKIVQRSQEDDMSDDKQENLMAADAIHETLLRNHYTQCSIYRIPPKQTLISLADSLDVNLAEYFDVRGSVNNRRFLPLAFQDGDNDDGIDEEYELSYNGIDAKPIWNEGTLVGTMLAVARGVTRLGPNETEDDYCWEVVSWKKSSHEDTYGNKKSCRFRGSYNALDVCPYRQCVYMNPALVPDDEWAEDDTIFSMWSGDSVIRVFSLCDKVIPASQTQPIAQWKCRSSVTAMVVAPFCGDLVLTATKERTLEIYKPTSSGATLEQEISIPDSVVATLRNHGRPENDIHSSPVTEFFVAKDVALDKAGFWTLQHSTLDGSTLILWRKATGEATWSISTILKLPLSSQRTPKILYDGHRLLVYGQDHIGMILLVYQVRSSNEDADTFRRVPVGQEACGGVLNVEDSLPITRFANRIRHVGLGGLENSFFEGLYLTANERFVVLNTKTGNLLSGSSTPFREGLLVIDLQDEYS